MKPAHHEDRREQNKPSNGEVLIKVKADSSINSCASYAAKLLFEGNQDKITLQGVGPANALIVRIVEYLRERIPNLHVAYSISSVEFESRHKGGKEENEDDKAKRSAPSLRAHLTTKDGVLKKEPGYMTPAEVQPKRAEEFKKQVEEGLQRPPRQPRERNQPRGEGRTGPHREHRQREDRDEKNGERGQNRRRNNDEEEHHRRGPRDQESNRGYVDRRNQREERPPRENREDPSGPRRRNDSNKEGGRRPQNERREGGQVQRRQGGEREARKESGNDFYDASYQRQRPQQGAPKGNRWEEEGQRTEQRPQKPSTNEPRPQREVGARGPNREQASGARRN